MDAKTKRLTIIGAVGAVLLIALYFVLYAGRGGEPAATNETVESSSELSERLKQSNPTPVNPEPTVAPGSARAPVQAR